MNSKLFFFVLILTLIMMTGIPVLAQDENDIDTFVKNFESNNDQQVLTGHIDSLAIIRGNAEFYLTDGELTFFDFGWEKPSAFYFKGDVRFRYSPPDEVERYQLQRFTDEDTLDAEFEEIMVYYTVDIPNLPDSSSLIRKKISKDKWLAHKNAWGDAFDYQKIYIPNHLLNDLISKVENGLFYADFRLDRYHLRQIIHLLKARSRPTFIT